jgi:hypothetical protein
MKTRPATPEDYNNLNNGFDADPMATEYRTFYGRVGVLWFQGKESRGKTGIVPLKPYLFSLPHLTLDFVVIRDGKTIFQCGMMSPEAAAVHAGLFQSLYSSGEFESDDDGQEGRWKKMKVSDAMAVKNERTAEPAPETTQTVESKPKKHKKTKGKKADAFDPFAGILY